MHASSRKGSFPFQVLGSLYAWSFNSIRLITSVRGNVEQLSCCPLPHTAVTPVTSCSVSLTPYAGPPPVIEDQWQGRSHSQLRGLRKNSAAVDLGRAGRYSSVFTFAMTFYVSTFPLDTAHQSELEFSNSPYYGSLFQEL